MVIVTATNASEGHLKRQECPICKHELSDVNLGRSLFLENRVQELLTVCISVSDTHLSVGNTVCNWTG